MEIKDIVTFSFSLVALGFSIYSIIRNRRREKNDLTFKMLDRWSSSLMRNARTSGWQFMRDHGFEGKIKNKKPIYINVIREQYPNDYRNLTEVLHFFADMNKLMKNGFVNKRLTKELFSSSIRSWFRYVEIIDYQTYKDPYSDYNRRLNEFLNEEIIPLAEELKISINPINHKKPLALKIEEMHEFAVELTQIEQKGDVYQIED